MLRTAVGLLTATALLLGAWPASAPAGAAEPERALTAIQKREVADLLENFRRTRETPDEQAKVVSQLIEIGGPAPAMLLEAVSRELQFLTARYQAEFFKQALALFAKAHAEDASQIDSLRQTVLGLGKDAGLTHEAIVAKADPAMKRLGQLLKIDRAEVLKQAPALQTERKELTELGRLRQRVADVVAKGAATPEAPGPPKFEDVLRGEEEACALLVLAPDDSRRKILMANAALEPKLQAEEARGIRDLNRIRLWLGLKPLKIDVALCEAARDHSKDMVEKKFLGHDSPVPGKRTPWDRAKNFGTSAGAENITGGADTGAAANDIWFHSPGHHMNMLGRHSRVGLGQCKQTWTQMFG